MTVDGFNRYGYLTRDSVGLGKILLSVDPDNWIAVLLSYEGICLPLPRKMLMFLLRLRIDFRKSFLMKKEGERAFLVRC